MRRFWIHPGLWVSLAVAACGSQGEESAPADQGGEEAAQATASSAGLDGCYLQRGTVEEAQNRASPLTELGFVYEGGAGLLCYGAPSANDREIMGGLVPYGELWRAGANEATQVHLTGPASIGGVSLDPGSYSLYALPGAESWEVFLNPSYERWGIPITEEVRATEVGSFTVTPEPTNGMVETLTYTFEPNADNTGGNLVMEWENTRLSFPVTGGSM